MFSMADLERQGNENNCWNARLSLDSLATVCCLCYCLLLALDFTGIHVILLLAPFLNSILQNSSMSFPRTFWGSSWMIPSCLRRMRWWKWSCHQLLQRPSFRQNTAIHCAGILGPSPHWPTFPPRTISMKVTRERSRIEQWAVLRETDVVDKRAWLAGIAKRFVDLKWEGRRHVKIETGNVSVCLLGKKPHP